MGTRKFLRLMGCIGMVISFGAAVPVCTGDGNVLGGANSGEGGAEGASLITCNCTQTVSSNTDFDTFEALISDDETICIDPSITISTGTPGEGDSINITQDNVTICGSGDAGTRPLFLNTRAGTGNTSRVFTGTGSNLSFFKLRIQAADDGTTNGAQSYAFVLSAPGVTPSTDRFEDVEIMSAQSGAFWSTSNLRTMVFNMMNLNGGTGTTNGAALTVTGNDVTITNSTIVHPGTNIGQYGISIGTGTYPFTIENTMITTSGADAITSGNNTTINLTDSTLTTPRRGVMMNSNITLNIGNTTIKKSDSGGAQTYALSCAGATVNALSGNILICNVNSGGSNTYSNVAGGAGCSDNLAYGTDTLNANGTDIQNCP